jgi:hypothetical protein
LSGYGAAESLAVIDHYVGPSPAKRSLREFVEGMPRLPMDVLGRWVRVLGACLTGARQYAKADLAGGQLWPEALILQLGNVFTNDYNSLPTEISALDHGRIEELLVAAGLDLAALLLMAFKIQATGGGYYVDHRREVIQALAGYDDAARRHTDAIRSAISLDKVADQQSALAMLLPLSARR